MITSVFTMLNNLLKRFVASKTIFLALDGPASSAKLETQRSRRFAKSSKQERDREQKKPGSLKVDSCMLTPGTPGIAHCKEALLYYAVQRLQHPRAPSGLQIIVSGADSPGEGETKIASWIIQNAPLLQSDRVLVVSEDPDVILYLLGSLVPHLYLLHETQDCFLLSSNEFHSELCRRLPLADTSQLAVDFLLVSESLALFGQLTLFLFRYRCYKGMITFRSCGVPRWSCGTGIWH